MTWPLSTRGTDQWPRVTCHHVASQLSARATVTLLHTITALIWYSTPNTNTPRPSVLPSSHSYKSIKAILLLNIDFNVSCCLFWSMMAVKGLFWNVNMSWAMLVIIQAIVIPPVLSHYQQYLQGALPSNYVSTDISTSFLSERGERVNSHVKSCEILFGRSPICFYLSSFPPLCSLARNPTLHWLSSKRQICKYPTADWAPLCSILFYTWLRWQKADKEEIFIDFCGERISWSYESERKNKKSWSGL